MSIVVTIWERSCNGECLVYYGLRALLFVLIVALIRVAFIWWANHITGE